MFIATQRLRLLAELEQPERYLKPEYFRAGRGPSGGGARPDQGQGEADQGRWIEVEREALAAGKVPGPDGAMVDLRRLVVTTDAGIGKTTTLQWLECQWNSQASDRAAMLLTFGDLRAVTLERVIPDLLCERLLVGQSTTDGEKNDARRVLEHLRDEGRLDLSVDGLDQAPPDGAAVALLAQLLASPQWRRCRIVVGGRPHSLQRHWALLFAPTAAPANAPIPTPWRFLSVD